MLDLSAQVAASVAQRFSVPVVWLSVQDLLEGKRGFTSHANISPAYHQSDHQDPGPAFPHAAYLQMVMEAVDSSTVAQPVADATHAATAASAPRLLRLAEPHLLGPDVRVVQEALRKNGLAVTVDGDFGPATARAVRAFQSSHELSPDGVVGPLTRRLLRFSNQLIVAVLQDMPEVSMIGRELVARAYLAIGRLSASDQALFDARCLHGEEYAELAAALNRTQGALREAVRALRARLRLLLARDGLNSAEIADYLCLIGLSEPYGRSRRRQGERG